MKNNTLVEQYRNIKWACMPTDPDTLGEVAQKYNRTTRKRMARANRIGWWNATRGRVSIEEITGRALRGYRRDA